MVESVKDGSMKKMFKNIKKYIETIHKLLGTQFRARHVWRSQQQQQQVVAMNELLSWQISLPSAPALSKKNDFKEAFQIESFN